MKGVQVMATISQQCNSLFSITFKNLLQAEISMISRAYVGEVLTHMSELFDKEVNAYKESL